MKVTVVRCGCCFTFLSLSYGGGGGITAVLVDVCFTTVSFSISKVQVYL